MLALIAALCFFAAIILNVAHAGHVELAMLVGLFFVALHLALGSPLALPWRRTPPAA